MIFWRVCSHRSFALFLVLCLVSPVRSLALAAEGEARIESKFELFISDVEESVAFYQILGFEVAHQKSYGYTTLRKNATVIALSPLPGWLPVHWLGFLRYPPIGTEIVLYTNELERLHAAMTDAGHGPGEIARQSWGDRDFRVTDEDGYYIRVSEGHAIAEPE